MRSFVDLLETRGELIRISDKVSPRYEVAAILKEVDRANGPAVIFERVEGYDIPVVGNLLGTKKRLALAFETSEEKLRDEFLMRRKQGIPPKLIEYSSRDNVIKDQVDLLRDLPVLTYHEKDAGPYITGGVVFLKDPVTGTTSMGPHRIQIKDKDKVCVSLLAGNARRILENVESRGEYLDVAIAIGLHPLTLLSAVTSMAKNKLEIAGGLRRVPVELIKCQMVDLHVPLEAEIVIEGKIPPGVREIDGPFGEVTGYYHTIKSSVIEVRSITFRKNPLYQAILPGSLEGKIVDEFTGSAQVLQDLKAHIPSIVDVKFSPISHIIISMKKSSEGEPKRALLLALMKYPYIKIGIAVDDDVDVNDSREVEWAIFTRSQGDKDISIVPDLPGSPLDPSASNGLTAKLGIDATKPLKQLEKFEKIKIPEGSKKKAQSILKKLFG